jgi:hypothetical protein
VTPLERVHRARRWLAATVAISALLWAATLTMAVVLLAAAIDLIVPLPSLVGAAIIPIGVVCALVAAAFVLWRGRGARSDATVALWIEERAPQLKYALVTAIDPRIAPAAAHATLHATASAANVEGFVRQAGWRSLGIALPFTVLALGLFVIMNPTELLRSASAELARRVGPGPTAPMANRLEPLSARVIPPAYARMSPQTVEDPSAIAGLLGTRVTFTGNGPADGVTALSGADTLEAERSGRGWSMSLMMPKEPGVLTLRDRDYRKLVILEPRPDSAPTVQLDLPANDTTYQTVPKGSLRIEATLNDDIGLAQGYVEYMLSSGSAESFDTKLSTGGRVAFGNSRSARLATTIQLDTMKLAPGTVLHLRVVGFDANNVAEKPGMGVSETRTLRIAEPLDSTSINPAPPLPIDSMWLSQRALNMKTDTLIRTKREFEQQAFVHKSSGYSNGQEDIRKRALAVVAILEDDGVGGRFETEPSKMLREAADLMLEARIHLGVAYPDSAIPFMRRALKILDELRMANRYYLRGQMKPVAVNIERVRLTGTDTAKATGRNPREELANAAAALAARLDRAAALARTQPVAAIDSLTYIRVSALRTSPALAQALGDAIESLKRGASIDEALAGARRALEPRAQIIAGPAEWGGISP